jgi:hypothetical protein
MTEKVFLPGDILLPKGVDLRLWSVIACDQFTSEPEYWEAVEARVGKAPSALRLMLPEAYLGQRDTEAEMKKIEETMEAYLNGGIFQTIPNSYIYTERQLSDGNTRRGLLGILDLEQYDYRENARCLVHPTEGIVEDRLPPRVEVRKRARLEMPHIVVFIDDPDCSVIDPIVYSLESPELLYDFDLMDGGGHIMGWYVGGQKAVEVEKALQRLADPRVLEEKYHISSESPVVFAVGDGNHSLAAAKLYWEGLKQTLSNDERESHPARYCMVELVNIHDSSVNFEPIHRVIFDTDPGPFTEKAREFWAEAGKKGGRSYSIKLAYGSETRDIEVCFSTIGELIEAADKFCEDYISAFGGRLDYIHGDETALSMATRPGCAGVLLPKMDKRELFPSIIRNGAFPRKSFSIGHARDKRYYLECRLIK